MIAANLVVEDWAVSTKSRRTAWLQMTLPPSSTQTGISAVASYWWYRVSKGLRLPDMWEIGLLLDPRPGLGQALEALGEKGASPGQLSVAATEAGQLSLAPETGQLSLATDPAGQLSLPPTERQV